VEFRSEHDAEKPVDDLGVGEAPALFGALLDDFRMFRASARRYRYGRDDDKEKQREEAARSF
jgi:hypothetical protein